MTKPTTLTNRTSRCGIPFPTQCHIQVTKKLVCDKKARGYDSNKYTWEGHKGSPLNIVDRQCPSWPYNGLNTTASSRVTLRAFSAPAPNGSGGPSESRITTVLQQTIAIVLSWLRVCKTLSLDVVLVDHEKIRLLASMPVLDQPSEET